jgi:Asp-tRNA(Asn)/Glu-tRNA(Gln) amidotransferase A subunit family amidase
MDVEPEVHDGLVASLLRGAGAIIVGKTNLPEFALEGYTDNRIFGPTRNPWDRSTSPGGSSGGSGAALAAGLAAIATATDVGGSVRIPAALCGLVGLKPTSGLIALDRSLIAPDLNSHGILTTTVADADLLLELMTSRAAGDGAMPSRQEERPGQLIVSERLVPGPALADGLAEAFHEAARALHAAVGGALEHANWTEIFPGGYELDDWFRIVGFEQAHELGHDVIAREADRLDPTFAAHMRRAVEITSDDHVAARERRLRYAGEMDRLLGDDAILVSPTLTVEGWSPDGRLPGRDESGLPSWVFNTEPPNLTGHPALSFPGGLLPDGRPFGLQLIGPRSSDRLLLDLAAAFERESPWAIGAPAYSSFTVDAVGGRSDWIRDALDPRLTT